MAFFRFSQNNSGGFYKTDRLAGIGANVIIEADNHDSANEKAESIGIYFNGVSDGIDCECCGDRWYRAWQDEGTTEPMVYGELVCREDYAWGPTAVHFSDGRIEWYGERK